MELISLKELPLGTRKAILTELGFSVDSKTLHIIDSNGNKVIDKYIEKAVTVDNMLILPGSTIILDDNPLSLTMYLEEFGDFLDDSGLN